MQDCNQIKVFFDVFSSPKCRTSLDLPCWTSSAMKGNIAVENPSREPLSWLLLLCLTHTLICCRSLCCQLLRNPVVALSITDFDELPQEYTDETALVRGARVQPVPPDCDARRGRGTRPCSRPRRWRSRIDGAKVHVREVAGVRVRARHLNKCF